MANNQIITLVRKQNTNFINWSHSQVKKKQWLYIFQSFRDYSSYFLVLKMSKFLKQEENLFIPRYVLRIYEKEVFFQFHTETLINRFQYNVLNSVFKAKRRKKKKKLIISSCLRQIRTVKSSNKKQNFIRTTKARSTLPLCSGIRLL